MSYYKNYLQKCVGGSVGIPRSKIKPGQIVSFMYTSDDATSGGRKKRRKYLRLVFALNTFRGGLGRSKLHGLSLEFIPWGSFKDFLRRILVKDTISLIKRRYDVVAPVNQLINRPRPFYETHVKKLTKFDCYRTYIINDMSNVKVTYLDFRTLFSDYENKDTLISDEDVIRDINQERLILETAIGMKLSKLNIKEFNRIIKDRFGTVRNFLKEYKEIEDFADKYDNKNKLKKYADNELNMYGNGKA